MRHLQKNAFSDVTVNLETVSKKANGLFASERGEAKFHTLSHAKAKIGRSSLARGCTSLATMAAARDGAARPGARGGTALEQHAAASIGRRVGQNVAASTVQAGARGKAAVRMARSGELRASGSLRWRAAASARWHGARHSGELGASMSLRRREWAARRARGGAARRELRASGSPRWHEQAARSGELEAVRHGAVRRDWEHGV
jgi:hypothetical protein